MIDCAMEYDIIYALAAMGGREAVLFGDCAPRAKEAFARSAVGSAFPELWFELPLRGEPWFDLHVLTASEDLDPDAVFGPDETAGYPGVFSWFAGYGGDVRQLAVSHDVGSGDAVTPAIQLLVRTPDPKPTCEFLAAAGRPDAESAYRAFRGRLPQGWFACYTGVFPERLGSAIRVECIPDPDVQRAYAHDAELLERDLRQAGFTGFGDTLISRCQVLAGAPFQFEFQFDVGADGLAGSTLGASVRFAMPPGTAECQTFQRDGAAGRLLERIQSWGLADDRWRLLADTAFSKRLSFAGSQARIYAYPTFVKLRWRDGQPLDAKAYIVAGEMA